jgi:hypothetical protein
MGSLVCRLWVVLGAVSLGIANSHAWDVESTLQLHAVKRLDDDACHEGVICDMPFNEQRLQLKLERRLGEANFFGKFDAAHDAALDESVHETRELYIDYNWERVSVRAGRQIITWGVGDLIFINDVFPKNWNALFSGQAMEYLKRGSDAVKIDAYPNWGAIELVISEFRPDLLPEPNRFIMEGLPAVTPRSIDDHSDTEYAIKASRMFGNWDTAVYAYQGFFHGPAYIPTASGLIGTLPQLNTYGASLAGAAFGGVISMEIGYYDSVEDNAGTEAAIENSQTKALIGYSREVAEDTTLGVQYFVENMHHYDAYQESLLLGMNPRERHKETATIRFTQRFLQQTLAFNIFALWGITEHDSYVMPSLRYAFTDELIGEFGANIFNGRPNGSFGSLTHNENVYFLVRYNF